MADNNNKLSLHIASKNVTTMTSGFVDVPAMPVNSERLFLNKQTVISLSGNVGSPVALTKTTGAFAHSLNVCIHDHSHHPGCIKNIKDNTGAGDGPL